MISVNCPICHCFARPVQERLVGYREDTVFSILECQACGLSFASPTVPDSTLYEWIYSSLDQVPGYARYAVYRERAKTEADPLKYLATEEPAYWACAEYLGCVQTRKQKPRILEIGCGAGYLTYALRQAGYDATGADLSTEAIQQATRAFGPFYKQLDILAQDSPPDDYYDVIIMLELIEHVPDPAAFMTSAKRLLKPHGELFVTTPRKPGIGGNAVWDTDLPPVHLHWFTREAFSAMAAALSASVSFSDFTGFHQRRHIIKAQRPSCNTAPTFSRDGKLLVSPPSRLQKPSKATQWSKAMADRLGVLHFYRDMVDRARHQERWRGPDGLTLAGWFTFAPLPK